MRRFTRVLAVVLAATFMLGLLPVGSLVFNVGAAVSDYKTYVPITVYPWAGTRFYAYMEDRTTQDGQIWPEDKCTINAIYDDGWVQVTYPVTGGTKTRYSQLSNFVVNTGATPKAFTATAQITAYQHPDMASSTGYLSAGDKCYAIGTSGSATQVLYPITGGYKLAWVATSQLPATTATYTVTYNANGGSGAPAAQTKTEGVTLTLPSTQPTRSGYTFKGWATSSTATVATYQAGGQYTANANVTLYAVWQTMTYTVSYNANGGTGAPAAQTKTYGATLALSSTIPTRTGYTFMGWGTTSAATVPTYQPGASYTANGNITLYAVWQADMYTVTYNANGGADAPATQSKTYGVALTLSTARPTRPNYTFKGWATTANATAATYQPGASYTANANLTLYAVWEKATVDGASPIMEISKVSGKVGDTVQVTVTMKNNPGIYCYILKPVYDKTQLSLVSMTSGAGMGGVFTDGNLAVWLGDEDDVTTNEVALILTFTILDGASGTIDVSISYQEGDICNYDEQDVNFYVVDGSVTVEGASSHTPGDINGDGVCNNKDLTRLKKYMSDPDNTVVFEEALDINGDGSHNNKDLTRLKKYMSDPDNVEIF